MPPANRARLIRSAMEARKNAVATYSKFKVGAALLARSGQIILGANVENASFGLTCCAERIAIFKALTDGIQDFRAIAVVARTPGGPIPCGACRQVLAEFAPEADVWVADTGKPLQIKRYSVEELLPHPFKVF